jgi:hypothetical protein
MLTMTPNTTETATADTGSSILKNLLLTQQWQAIANHIRTNPIDAKNPLEINGVKALPLHIACAIGAPIGVIKSLIGAYSIATQIKNDSGRLPLHCLFLHRCPTLAVLSSIIEAYPAASHIADGTGKLAIHYACEQKGVTDDFFTILLSTYPEGAYARDFSGKFPINYATSNTDGITKKCALAALDRGTLFASISKMTSNRVMDEQQAKMNSLEESYVAKMRTMESHAKEERIKLKSEINEIKSQLKDAKDEKLKLVEELNEAETKKDNSVKEAIETEQAKATELEKNLRMELADMQLQNMDLLEQVESIQLDLDDSRTSNDNKAKEIDALKKELDDAKDKIASLELVNQEKCNYISHLEESLLKAQNAVMALAGKQEEMQKIMEGQKEVLNNVLLAHSATVGHVGGLFVDMINLADDIGGTIKAGE